VQGDSHVIRYTANPQKEDKEALKSHLQHWGIIPLINTDHGV